MWWFSRKKEEKKIKGKTVEGKLGIALIEKISGGFSDVYKARTSKNEIIAIKILKKKQVDTVSTNIFLKEASTLKNLKHANIVELYEYDEKPIPWFCMEYMDGKSLRERLDHLNINESGEIIIKIAKALEYAHSRGVIHRDIKPEYILFKDDEPKLCGWALGKDLSDYISMETLDSGFMGTYVYAAPEQFSNKFGTVDYQTDIYQLGMVFYEMVSRCLPYKFESLWTLVENVTSENDPLPPSKINFQVPKKLDDIIMKCLAKNKENRYQNLSDLIRELGG